MFEPFTYIITLNVFLPVARVNGSFEFFFSSNVLHNRRICVTDNESTRRRRPQLCIYIILFTRKQHSRPDERALNGYNNSTYTLYIRTYVYMYVCVYYGIMHFVIDQTTSDRTAIDKQPPKNA